MIDDLRQTWPFSREVFTIERARESYQKIFIVDLRILDRLSSAANCCTNSYNALARRHATRQNVTSLTHMPTFKSLITMTLSARTRSKRTGMLSIQHLVRLSIYSSAFIHQGRPGYTQQLHRLASNNFISNELDFEEMPRGVKKENLPVKTCTVCNRPFTWRKKWEKVWE